MSLGSLPLRLAGKLRLILLAAAAGGLACATTGSSSMGDQPNSVANARPLERNIAPVADTISVTGDTEGGLHADKKDRKTGEGGEGDTQPQPETSPLPQPAVSDTGAQP